MPSGQRSPELIGRSDWTSMSRDERHDRADELDDAITAWTRVVTAPS